MTVPEQWQQYCQFEGCEEQALADVEYIDHEARGWYRIRVCVDHLTVPQERMQWVNLIEGGRRMSVREAR